MAQGRISSMADGQIKLRIKTDRQEHGQIQIQDMMSPEEQDFFKKYADFPISYEKHKRRTVQNYSISRKLSLGPVATHLWPTLAGRSVQDLYKEIIFDMVHSFKSKEKLTLTGQSLFTHLQKVFHIDDDLHKQIITDTIDAQPPSLVLNLEVVEAKGLIGQDANGLSDPFCTLYISSDKKYRTSVQSMTLQPIWNEYFSLPVKNVQEDILHVEVWDYDDPQETISEKFKKLGEIHSTRGLRSFFKEIALPPQTKDNSNDFHGATQLPLISIPTDNFDAWFPLRIQDADVIKGQIRLRMTIGVEKDRKYAAQAYRHVLYLLIIDELDTNPELCYNWAGIFETCEPDIILSRLQRQGGLLPYDIDLAKWLIYTHVQCKYPLDTRIFAPLFLSVVEHLKKGNLDGADVQRFWSASMKLVESFAGFIQNIHEILTTHNLQQVTQSHQIIQTLALLIDLLRSCLQNHSTQKMNDDGDFNIQFILQAVTNAISMGATELFVSVWKENDVEQNMEDAKTIIKIGQILMADLQNGLNTLQRHFQTLLSIDFFEITYKIYDVKYSEIVEPVVKRLCWNLKPLETNKKSVATCPNEDSSNAQDISTKTTLFELYLTLKQFSDLSATIKSRDGLKIHGNFHLWFFNVVQHWLDIAWFKAGQRIESAIQLDTFIPVCEQSLLTSSAVDASQIFHQIIITWDQLSWPDVESSTALVAKIIDDLCVCVIQYAEVVCKKVKKLERHSSQDICGELCLVVNNIEHLDREMNIIVTKLKLEELFEDLEIKIGTFGSTRFRTSVETIMESAHANIGAKLNKIIQKLWSRVKPKQNPSNMSDTQIRIVDFSKMESTICRILNNIFDHVIPIEKTQKDQNADELMVYLEKNLLKLRDNLTDKAFEKILAYTWNHISKLLMDGTNNCVEKSRPCSTFQRIERVMKNLLNFFDYPEAPFETAECEIVKKIEEIVKHYGASTKDLILKFQEERSQGRIKSTETGNIALCAVYYEKIETLKIEILNCSNLKSTDSNGLSDPFVRIRLEPRHLFPDIPRFKTRVEKNTLFPLFEEEFNIPLSSKSASLGGLIHVTVKDYDLIGRNDFVGEVFIPLKSIKILDAPQDLTFTPQLHLTLTAPGDSVIIQTLENRHGDKIAIDFAKKQRRRQES